MLNTQGPHQPRRITGIDAWLMDRSRDYGASAYYNVIANIYRQDGRIGADTNAVSYPGSTPKTTVPASGSIDGEAIVDEHHPMPNEAVLADCHPFAYEAVGLNLGSSPDEDGSLHLNKRTDQDTITEHAVIDIARHNDPDVVAAGHVSNPAVDDLGIRHCNTHSPMCLGTRNFDESLNHPLLLGG